MQKGPIHSVIGLLKIEKHDREWTVSLLRPSRGLPKSKDVVQDAPILDKTYLRVMNEVWQELSKTKTDRLG